MARFFDALLGTARGESNPKGAERAEAGPAQPHPGDATLVALFESLAAAVFVQQGERIVFANAAAGALTGVQAAELAGRTLSDFLPSDFSASLRQRWRSSLEAGQPERFEARFLAQDGSERWADVTATSIDFQGRPAGLSVAFEVTERRLAENALREAERRMRDVLENVQLVAVELDAAGEVVFANPFFLELVDHDEEAVVGRDWFATFAPLEQRDELRRRFLERMGQGLVQPHEEGEVVTRHDERRLISWNHTPLHDLTGRLAGTISVGSDITDRRRVEQQLVHDALHDALTGLPNRALFLDHLASALARVRRRHPALLGVLFLDVDRFKLVNDSLGHGLGDQLLVELTRLLRAAVRPGDIVARLGGDEFAVLLEDLGTASDASRVAERVHAALASPFSLSGQEVFASASIGIALSTREYQRPDDLLRDADTALYQAKGAGRARSQLFDTSMHNHAMRLLALENDLRRAVESEHFILHYQPIVELEGGRITGFEALLRWEHSERGLVSPVEFVHLAEEVGLIVEIGAWALREACRTLRAWMDAWPGELEMSVNFSGRQFSQPDLVERVGDALAEAGVPATRLKIEITESVIMENAESAIAILGRLKERGVRVCIDDFGTGYSSLGYLLRLPADTLKIDRAFVSALGRGPRHQQILQSIVALGGSLGMDVVAEGVESEDQRARLCALGCRYGQGFLFSRPVDRERADALIAAQAARGRAAEA